MYNSIIEFNEIDTTKNEKVQSKKIFGSVAAKNAELLGRDTHT